MFQPSTIVAVDIGSPRKGSLGWAALPSRTTGKSIDRLAELIASELVRGPVALGLEAPLWVPMRDDELKLLNGRIGEGSRSWSAFAGPTALTTGLGVIPFILRSIRQRCPAVSASLDWRDPPNHPETILFWEAFVSGSDKGVSHEDDALIAAQAFQDALGDLDLAQKLSPEPSFNLLGAMLLRTGWTKDTSVLGADTLVVRV